MSRMTRHRRTAERIQELTKELARFETITGRHHIGTSGVSTRPPGHSCHKCVTLYRIKES